MALTSLELSLLAAALLPPGFVASALAQGDTKHETKKQVETKSAREDVNNPVAVITITRLGDD